MKNIKEFLYTEMTDKQALIATLSVPIISMGLLIITGLSSQSENNLTEFKEKKLNQTVPNQSDVCSSAFDTDCYLKLEREMCDGQNTILNFKDDVCEDIPYWSYIPGFW